MKKKNHDDSKVQLNPENIGPGGGGKEKIAGKLNQTFNQMAYFQGL
jgi:hypothetical protein